MGVPDQKKSWPVPLMSVTLVCIDWKVAPIGFTRREFEQIFLSDFVFFAKNQSEVVKFRVLILCRVHCCSVNDMANKIFFDPNELPENQRQLHRVNTVIMFYTI